MTASSAKRKPAGVNRVGDRLRATCLASASLAILALLGASGAARAADPAVHVQAAPPVGPDWTGFYVGGHLGLADAFTHYDYSTLFSGALNNHTRIGRINGAAPGVYGGFNYQLGPVVVGVEGDGTFTNGMFRLNGPSVDFLQTSNSIVTASGRLGYLVSPATMLYGRAGYSWIVLQGVQGFGTPFKQTLPGTQVGLGIEHLITDNVAFRMEGTYTRADSTLALNQGFDQYRPSFLQVTLGLAFKLDPLPHQAAPILPTIDFASRFITHEPSWTSVYAGGVAGLGAGQVTRYDRVFGQMGPYSDLRFSGGAMGGVDLQFAKYFVVGAGVDTIWMNSTFDDDVGVGITTVVHRFAHIDRVSAVTGRLGVLLSPTILAYGKAGIAQIRFVPDQLYFQSINPAVRVGAHDLPSTQFGFGLETLVADHVAVRVETLYTRATHGVVIDGVQPAQTSLQPSALTGTVGLVVKY